MLEMYPNGQFVLLTITKPQESKIIVAGAEQADTRNEFRVARLGPEAKFLKVGDIVVCGPHIFTSKFRDGLYYLVEEKMVISVVRENPKQKEEIPGVTVARNTPYESNGEL